MLSSSANAPAAAQATAVRRFARVLVPSAIALAATAAACSSSKRPDPAPAFREDVAAVFQAKCVECHSGDAPKGGWRASSYMDVIGCVASDGSAATVVSATDGTSPITRALAARSHNEGLPVAKRLSDLERSVIARWIDAGAPAWRSAIHPVGFVDPRSADHHSKFLRARKWLPMRDPTYTPDPADVNDPGACGQCHSGLPADATPMPQKTADNPDGTKVFAPAATACTTCHNKPGGVLNCTTCHGSGDKPYAVRDVCFHPASDRGPNEATPDRQRNHEGHVLGGSQFMNQTLQCNACHNVPGGSGTLDILNGLAGGTHANGQIDVIVAPGVGGTGATWDPATRSCNNTRCHSVTPDAKVPSPSFDRAEKIKCGDCHGTPPATTALPNHYLSPDGTCTFCHKEVRVAADGTKSLVQPFSMHLDGVIEKGDGKGRCNSCHGNTGVSDPTQVSAAPSTGSHPAHFNPKFRKAGIDCGTCHVVPTLADKHPLGDTGHGHVTFSGLAASGGFKTGYDAMNKTCTVYCHSAIPGGVVPNPAWGGGSGPTPVGGRCGDCHGAPPPNHFAGTCGVGACHSGIVNPPVNPGDFPTFTDPGKGVHINGAIDTRFP